MLRHHPHPAEGSGEGPGAASPPPGLTQPLVTALPRPLGTGELLHPPALGPGSGQGRPLEPAPLRSLGQGSVQPRSALQGCPEFPHSSAWSGATAGAASSCLKGAVACAGSDVDGAPRTPQAERGQTRLLCGTISAGAPGKSIAFRWCGGAPGAGATKAGLFLGME